MLWLEIYSFFLMFTYGLKALFLIGTYLYFRSYNALEVPEDEIKVVSRD